MRRYSGGTGARISTPPMNWDCILLWVLELLGPGRLLWVPGLHDAQGETEDRWQAGRRRRQTAAAGGGRRGCTVSAAVGQIVSAPAHTCREHTAINLAPSGSAGCRRECRSARPAAHARAMKHTANASPVPLTLEKVRSSHNEAGTRGICL